MAQANYFKKRSARSLSRLSYSSASEDDGSKAIAVPDGLRSLLNDISREVSTRHLIMYSWFFEIRLKKSKIVGEARIPKTA